VIYKISSLIFKEKKNIGRLKRLECSVQSVQTHYGVRFARAKSNRKDRITGG